MSIYQDLLSKKKAISVTGLGYVGLPLALEFAKYFRVIRFDINAERVEQMRDGIDPSNELDATAFDGTDIQFTTNPDELRVAHFHIIGVPTDIDEHKVPDLRPLLAASQSIGQILKEGDYVVFESTVYPGCTEEDCVPVLEEQSQLKSIVDFKYGYSPERINPGDKERTLTRILKIVSGCDSTALETISMVYGKIIKAGIHEAPSVKVAEAAKVIENTQRDINIAFMNELSIIFDRMDLSTQDVLEAAGTKWNFLKFSPGLVGGHCIGVDPYYLAHKATQLGYLPKIILGGRRLNDSMPAHIAERVAHNLRKAGKVIGECQVLVLGITFKENVSDIRNSKVVNLIQELHSNSISVKIADPYASVEEVKMHYSLKMTNEIPDGLFDAIIVAVGHEEYKRLSHSDILSRLNPNAFLYDIKSLYGGYNFSPDIYWSL